MHNQPRKEKFNKPPVSDIHNVLMHELYMYVSNLQIQYVHLIQNILTLGKEKEKRKCPESESKEGEKDRFHLGGDIITKCDQHHIH